MRSSAVPRHAVPHEESVLYSGTASEAHAVLLPEYASGSTERRQAASFGAGAGRLSSGARCLQLRCDELLDLLTSRIAPARQESGLDDPGNRQLWRTGIRPGDEGGR